jgi:hypothetical protein
MKQILSVRALPAALAAVASVFLAGCSYSLESNTQKPGRMDSVVVAPPSDV